ncbi:MATE family efflux transporter [Bizionia paragorgiae]|uniref:MATE family efflux transporter n=1 Tax=Bizionia paragorgiae TaxID=283786 RepID=UPI003A8D4F0A
MTVKKGIRDFNKYFKLVLKSIKGGEVDYTKINLTKAVILLAIPMMLEMMMESVFALVDLYFVGHLEESSFAIQTVGLTESVLTIMYSIAIGLSMAATAVVARRIGEKDAKKAALSAAQAILIAGLLTIVLSIFGVIFAKDILLLMGASPESAEYGKTFTAIMFGSSISIILLFLINGIFRGAGNAAIAMKSLWLANICNIILCPILIQGWFGLPALGLTGAAVATATGRSIGVMYQLYHLFIAPSIVSLKLKNFVPDVEIMGRLLKIATPAVFQFIIASCSWIVLARLVAITGGDEGSAGYQTALRLMMFFMLPAWGLSSAATTLVGQNLGADQPERAEASVMKTVLFNVIYMIFVSLIFFLLATVLVEIFTEEERVGVIAKNAMYVMASGFVFYGIGMVMLNAFNGSGDTWTPTKINFFGFWLLQIPLAYVLAQSLNFNEMGVFIAIPVSEMAITIASYIIFKRGKWKTIQV